MQAVGYAAGALVFFGAGDFLFKRAADRGLRAHHFLALQSMFFAPSVLVLAYVDGVLVWNPNALWGSLAGAFIFAGLYFFSRSLAGGAVSLNAPLFRMNFMVTATLAIVILGEHLTPNKIAGLLAALTAVWLLVGGASKRGVQAVPGLRRSLWQALLATAAFGTGSFCHKVGLGQGVPVLTMMAGQVVVFASLSFAASTAIDGGLKVPWSSWPTGLGAAAVLLAGFICLLLGFESGEASLVAPLAQMGFIVTAALGIVLLGERFTLRKASGLAAAAVALAAFAL